MATFTSWQDLLTQLKNDIASGDWRVKQYRTPDGRQVEYRDLDDVLAFHAWVKDNAAGEAAAAGAPTRRAHVRAHGSTWS